MMNSKIRIQNSPRLDENVKTHPNSKLKDMLIIGVQKSAKFIQKANHKSTKFTI